MGKVPLRFPTVAVRRTSVSRLLDEATIARLASEFSVQSLQQNPEVKRAVVKLAKRVERYEKARKAHRSTALRVARWIVNMGDHFGETSAIRNDKRVAHILEHKPQFGDILVVDLSGNAVRWLVGSGNAPIERAAWTVAAVRAAYRIVLEEPEAVCFDRVEYSARSIRGVPQGTRLNQDKVKELREELGEDLFHFQVQVLHRYPQNAPREVLQAFEERADRRVDWRLPNITSEAVNHVEVDDPREAESVHFEFGLRHHDSMWHHMFVDEEPFSLTRTWVEDDSTFDDEVDRYGFARREDLYNPRTIEEVQAERAQVVNRYRHLIARGRAVQHSPAGSKLRQDLRRFLDNVYRSQERGGSARLASLEEIAARTGSSPSRSTGGSAHQENGDVPSPEGTRAQEVMDAILARRRQVEPPTNKWEGYRVIQVGRLAGEYDRTEKLEAGLDEGSPELAVDEQVAVASLPQERADKKSLDDVSRADFDRRALLAKDTEEVLRHQKEDVPQTDLELLEESVAYFLTGEDPDEDLDIEKAYAEVPGLRAAMAPHRARRATQNAPRGLMASVARERAKKGDRLTATYFLRGLQDLENALGSSALGSAAA